MKSVIAILVAVAVVGMVGSVMAADAAKAATPAFVTVSGTVSVVKDTKGAVTGIELATADGTQYNVTMSNEGKMLDKENGKKVEVVGMITEKSGKKWLHVKSFKLAEPAASSMPAK